ncbi:hypothetical protein COOONC_07608 [Cooperia oncophora]
MVNSVYTVVYRNAAYTMVMFFLPFAILTFVNLRIIATLRSSYRMRRMMTMHPRKKRESTPITVDTLTTVADSAPKTVSMGTFPESGSISATNDKSEGERRDGDAGGDNERIPSVQLIGLRQQRP